MRRTETSVRALLDAVILDYRNNEYASIGTLVVNIKHLDPVFSKRSAERVKSHDVEQYKIDRLKAGASRATINLELTTLKRAFNLGIQSGIVKTKPTIQLFRIGNKNRRIGFFEHNDYLTQLHHLKLYQAQCLRFAYICGWRENELFNLTWKENFTADPPTIRIYKSKNGDGRVLPLIGGLKQLIDEQYESRLPGCPWIFHYEGRKVNRYTFNKHWRAACAASGVKRHFHDLRRTASRNLRRSGVDQAERMAIIGHKTISMDLRYGIVNEDDITRSLTSVLAMLKKRGSEDEGVDSNTHGETLVAVDLSKLEINQSIGGERGIRTLESDVSDFTLSSRVSNFNPLNWLRKFVYTLRKRCKVMVLLLFIKL